MTYKGQQSHTERILISALKDLGLNPKEQHPIGKMHVDIAFPNEMLVIEVNGPHHKEIGQQFTDERRAYIIEKLGWKIQEIDVKEIDTNPQLIAEIIKKDVEKAQRGEDVGWLPLSIQNKEDFMDENFTHKMNLANNTKKPIFFSGKAGTGKSTFIQLFLQQTDDFVVKLAPTGISAVNIKGQTIHSFFGLKSGLILPEDIDNSVANEWVKKRILAMHTLIIDEISMVRVDIFDAIDEILRRIKNSNEAFGGIKLLLFGDLYQLPPIAKEKIERQNLKERYGHDILYLFGSNAFKNLGLEIHHFSEVYRQRDSEFVKILDKVRLGKIKMSDIEKFRNRCLNDLNKINYMPVIITSKNKNVDNYNHIEFSKIDEKLHTYEAEISGKFDPNEMPVVEKLELKKGAQVMILKNKKGIYANGDLGIIEECLPEGVLVKVYRTRKYEYIAKDIFYDYKYYTDENGKLRKWAPAYMYQIPIKLGWAMTIHKSQGLTLNHIFIDSSPGIWAPGQMYVAMSRCTSFDSLYFKTLPKISDFLSNPVVDRFFMENSQAEAIA
jgi:ATP-dependent DNA helicase PIF1